MVCCKHQAKPCCFIWPFNISNIDFKRLEKDCAGVRSNNIFSKTIIILCFKWSHAACLSPKTQSWLWHFQSILCPCWCVPAENKSEILYRRATCLVSAGAFEDEDIIHVEGTVDPVRDMEIIHEELRLKDEEMIGPIIDKLEKTAIRGGDKKLKPEYVSQCPSRPFASPHSEAQIITLPLTWLQREKKYCFFNLPPMGLTPPPALFFPSWDWKWSGVRGFLL